VAVDSPGVPSTYPIGAVSSPVIYSTVAKSAEDIFLLALGHPRQMRKSRGRICIELKGDLPVLW